MNTLEKVLDFEKEADNIIQKAQKMASDLLEAQEEKRKAIEREFEDRIAREKKAIKAQWEERIATLGKEEAKRREDILKKLKTDAFTRMEKAIEVVINNILN
ncbi:MAG: hypothetical protein K6U11_06595 [bacterium]|nr:hypothetical protein [bacterium]